MTDTEPGLGGIDAVGTLVDPVRRSAYRMVAGAAEPIGRDDVADQLGIGRTLAAFHLDKLVAAGLLEVSYARRNGRTGPGAGRPAKLYRTAPGGFEVSVPPRAYAEAAEVFVETIDRLGADEALFSTARRRGVEVGVRLGTPDVVAALGAQGYEPVAEGATIRLRNCPFHTVARQYPPLVCGMNLALLEGMVEGAGWVRWRATIDPASDGCCVTLSKTKND